MYPERYRLSSVTAHVLSLLERRRAAHESWDDLTETQLTQAAREAVTEIGEQFRTVAHDPEYWPRVERSVVDAVLPRYLAAAKAQHELERRHYDLWRKGDWLARLVYVLGGVAVAFLALRLPLLRWWLGPLSLVLIGTAPFFPDIKVWWARRKYARRLEKLVEEMGDEQRQLDAYPSLGLPGDSAS